MPSPANIILILLLQSENTRVKLLSNYIFHSNFCCPEVNVRERATTFEDDGVRVILEWDEVNPLYSVIITITPETQVNSSRSTSRLTVAYNILYNISVIVSHPCRQNSVTVFSEVYYYPRTNARECSTSVFFYLLKLIA